MRVQHILSAIEFADQEDRAFNEALRLASHYGSRLTVVHAIPARERFNEDSRRRRRRLAAMVLAGHAKGVTVHVAVQQGDPAGVILLHARARGVDLIVLGTHGRRGASRYRLGSVAEAVVEQAPCPTLVVPLSGVRGSGPVLCAVDLTSASAATVEHAIHAAGTVATGSSGLVVLHVLESIPADEGLRYGWRFADRDYRQYLHLAAWRRLESVIPSRARIAGTTRTRVVAGDPGKQIGAVAREMNAQLIVIGAKARGFLSRRFLRSTAATIMRTAPCPVLIVPPGSRIAALPVEALERAA